MVGEVRRTRYRAVLSLSIVHGCSHVAEVFQDDLQFSQRRALGVALLHHRAQFFKISRKSHLSDNTKGQGRTTDRRREEEGLRGECNPETELILAIINKHLLLMVLSHRRTSDSMRAFKMTEV